MISFSGKFRVAFVLCLVTGFSLFAGELDSWYATSALAGPYAGIRKELSLLVGNTVSGGIPESIIVDRIHEGSAKKVPPAKLLAVLQSDCAQFLFVQSTLQSLFPLDLASAQTVSSFLVTGGMILRSGIPRDAFVSSLPSDATAPDQMRRALDALLAVAAVQTRSPLDSARISKLSLALYGSGEKSERFSVLSSLFVRGRSGSLAPSEIADLVVSVLSRGNGFMQAENEISRRTR